MCQKRLLSIFSDPITDYRSAMKSAMKSAMMSAMMLDVGHFGAVSESYVSYNNFRRKVLCALGRQKVLHFPGVNVIFLY